MKKLKSIIYMCLFFCSTFLFAAKVDTLQVASVAMNKTYKAAIVLPNSYAKSKTAYPVLYLLHGAYGHFNDWLSKTPNKEAVKNLSRPIRYNYCNARRGDF